MRRSFAAGKIVRSIPYDILYSVSTVLLYALFLFTIRSANPYTNYLFLFVASILSIAIFGPTLYLTPVYYAIGKAALLFFGGGNLRWSGNTTILLTYISPHSRENPFLAHSLSQPYIINSIHYRFHYLSVVFAHFHIVTTVEVLVITLSVVPFLLVKRKLEFSTEEHITNEQSCEEDGKLRKLFYLFFYGALIAVPSDYLLSFLIVKGISSIYILPTVLLVFSIAVSVLLTDKLFPNIKNWRVIFLPIVALFFFYFVVSGGAILLLPFILPNGLLNVLIVAFPYFELPLLLSGAVAYLYARRTRRNIN